MEDEVIAERRDGGTRQRQHERGEATWPATRFESRPDLLDPTLDEQAGEDLGAGRVHMTVSIRFPFQTGVRKLAGS